MYCIHCGKNLEGNQYCTNCGMKAASTYTTNSQPASSALFSTPPKTVSSNKSRNGIFASIGAAVVIVIVILVLTIAKPVNRYPIPYVNDTNQNSKGFVLPPTDFSNDFTEEYGGYNNRSRICSACHGSGYCSICKGTGQYSMYGTELSECTACHGTGDCSICGGDGTY